MHGKNQVSHAFVPFNFLPYFIFASPSLSSPSKPERLNRHPISQTFP